MKRNLKLTIAGIAFATVANHFGFWTMIIDHDIVGTYHDTIINITLHSNHTVTGQTIDASDSIDDKTFQENVNFAWHKEGDIIVLTVESKTTDPYVVGEARFVRFPEGLVPYINKYSRKGLTLENRTTNHITTAGLNHTLTPGRAAQYNVNR